MRLNLFSLLLSVYVLTSLTVVEGDVAWSELTAQQLSDLPPSEFANITGTQLVSIKIDVRYHVRRDQTILLILFRF
jgi:hypothetical protein